MSEALLSVSDVAGMFGVNEKTVVRWENAGKLPASFRTMGGHRRWRKSEIDAAIEKLSS